MSVPPWRAAPRPRRAAPERRAQRLRAEGRAVQVLLRCFDELGRHRGGCPSRLGAALATALRPPRAEPASVRSSGQLQALQQVFAQPTAGVPASGVPAAGVHAGGVPAAGVQPDRSPAAAGVSAAG
eukprot:2610793-Pyramimonas_sp.AAC.1